MSEFKNIEEFAKNLVAQDAPVTDEQLRRNETLLKKIKRRMCLQKAVIIAIYLVLYCVAFGAFMLRTSTDNVIHSICWGTVSLHILLWSFVYILRGNCMNMEELIEKKFDNDEKRRHKSENWFITILAIVGFAFSSFCLYRYFFFTNALKAVQMAVGILWATIIFLIYYSFRTASLIGKLWLEYKKMELNITRPEQQSSKKQDE